jgi:hypothetical protein
MPSRCSHRAVQKNTTVVFPSNDCQDKRNSNFCKTEWARQTFKKQSLANDLIAWLARTIFQAISAFTVAMGASKLEEDFNATEHHLLFYNVPIIWHFFEGTRGKRGISSREKAIVKEKPSAAI